MGNYIKAKIPMQLENQRTGSETEVREILIDRKKNGRIVNWIGFKVKNMWLADSYNRLGMPEKEARLKTCAKFLWFQGETLQKVMFCKVSLCPVCSYRRTNKIFHQASKIMNYMETGEEKFRYVFLTLTVKNVSGDKLSSAIDEMMYGFKKMMLREKIKRATVGWFRAMEITHNWKGNTYHHHLHIVLVVRPSYFTRYENYLRHEDFRREWKSCMKLGYDPIVNVKRVSKTKHGETEEMTYWKAVSELAKYAVKPSDYIVDWLDRDKFEKENRGVWLKDKKQCEEMTDEVVAILDKAIHKRRLVAYGGVMKEIHKKLNLDDAIDGDLIHTGDELANELNEELKCFKFFVGVRQYLRVDMP